MGRHGHRALLLSALCVVLAATGAQAQVFQGKKIVEASLVADTTAIVPGQPFHVGLHLRIAPDWHVYWKNPGDSGIATSPEWDFPKNFQIGELQWPLPLRLIEPGDIAVYAYRNEVLLMAEVTPPENLQGTDIKLRAAPKWLVCHEICIPGAAEIVLTLPIAPSAESANAELFAKFKTLLPTSSSPPFGVTWTRTPAGWNLSLRGADAKQADFLPFANDTVPVGPAEPRMITGGIADLAIPAEGSPPIAGVIVLENGHRQGWIASSDKNIAPPAAFTSAPTPKPNATGLLRYLIFGFLGGFILNLMPCVLPVISLKIFGFMRQSGDSRASIFKHGLAFTTGIFVWFLGLAAVVIALKSAGSEVTWAFQFRRV